MRVYIGVKWMMLQIHLKQCMLDCTTPEKVFSKSLFTVSTIFIALSTNYLRSDYSINS